MQPVIYRKGSLSNTTVWQPCAAENVNNNILFKCVTPIIVLEKSELLSPDSAGADNRSVPPAISVTSFRWGNFHSIWNSLQADQKENSEIVRSYWLGDSYPYREFSEKLVSDYLVDSLAEIVRRYKSDISMAYLTPFDPTIAAKESHKFTVGEPFTVWFESVKRGAKYDIDIVRKFALGKKIEPIVDSAFGATTEVLSADEIERIYEALKLREEPRLEIRPVDWDKSKQLDNQLNDLLSELSKVLASSQAANNQQIEKLLNAISSGVEEKKTSNKTNKKQSEKETALEAAAS